MAIITSKHNNKNVINAWLLVVLLVLQDNPSSCLAFTTIEQFPNSLSFSSTLTRQKIIQPSLNVLPSLPKTKEHRTVLSRPPTNLVPASLLSLPSLFFRLQSSASTSSPLVLFATNSKATTTTTSTTYTTFTTKKRNKNEQNWMENYQQLKQFHKQYGHANVPREWEQNISLGIWVNNQRTWYRKYYTNINENYNLKSSVLSFHQERIRLLNEIGFEWDKKYSTGKPSNNDKWMIRYNELKNYKKIYGHVNVPQCSKINKSLGSWVKRHRMWYKNRTNNGETNGEFNAVEQERIDLLNEIGFEWVRQIGKKTTVEEEEEKRK